MGSKGKGKGGFHDWFGVGGVWEGIMIVRGIYDEKNEDNANCERLLLVGSAFHWP